MRQELEKGRNERAQLEMRMLTTRKRDLQSIRTLGDEKRALMEQLAALREGGTKLSSRSVARARSRVHGLTRGR